MVKAEEVIETMKKNQTHPTDSTYLILIRGFCRVGQLANAEALVQDLRKVGEETMEPYSASDFLYLCAEVGHQGFLTRIVRGAGCGFVDILSGIRDPYTRVVWKLE